MQWYWLWLGVAETSSVKALRLRSQETTTIFPFTLLFFR
jgi:hypothetical protein